MLDNGYDPAANRWTPIQKWVVSHWKYQDGRAYGMQITWCEGLSVILTLDGTYDTSRKMSIVRN